MADKAISALEFPTWRQRLQADLLLFGVAVVWGSAFVVQRIAALEVGVFWFTGMRFLAGALVLLPLKRLRLWQQPAAGRLTPRSLTGVLAAGALLWGGGALQQAGLQYTTAGNAGFITGLYVVLIPLIQRFLLRQSLRRTIWPAVGLAAGGLFLLSTGGQLRLNPGDALELAGAVLWALHVILVSRLVRQISVIQFSIGQYVTCGLLGVLSGLLFEPGGWVALWQNAWVVLYAGCLSVGLGYTLQAAGQRISPPADAAILLSLEAVFAVIFEWLILGVMLLPVQLIGCGVMLAGMLLAQAEAFRAGQRHKDRSL